MGTTHNTGRGGHWEYCSLGPYATLLMPPQVPNRLCCNSSWPDRVGKRLSVQAELAIYTYIVTVSGQYLSVAITLRIKWISAIMTMQSVFANPVTYAFY